MTPSIRSLVAACLVVFAACSSEDLHPVPVDGAAVRGPADAWVTVVEFSDFQCPFCALAEPTLAQLATEYGADLRLVYRHLPLDFHARAMPAALAAECAGEQGRFWEMHDALFADRTRLEDADLEQRAGVIGLEVERWKACLGSTAPRARIESDKQLALAQGVEGTPTFFINGRKLVGAPIDELRALIDEELEKARESGIARADYYAKAVLGR